MKARATTAPNQDESSGAQPQVRNEVTLVGRLAAAAEERELPSGDRIVTLRVVVPRGPVDRHRPRTASGQTPRTAAVDTIDVVCWSAVIQRCALRLPAGDEIEVVGALRRRFFGGPGGRQSRYEVEAAVLRRWRGAAGRAT